MTDKIYCAQIDLARQKENFEYIKSYFDRVKQWGYNYILIYMQHIVRTSVNDFFDVEKTYSKAEIAEIAEYAKSIGLKTIPSLHNLTYMDGFISHEEFKHFSCGESRWNKNNRSACACISHPEWYPFIEQYLSEVIELFPDSEYVHMNMDELFEFALCDRCKERIKKGETKASMFLGHIIRTNDFIKSKGKTMMIGDDWFEYSDLVHDIPKDIIVTPWHYVFMSDEPNGHWTNRVKRDWFKQYNQLGFKTVALFYSHRSSSPVNIETFTNYLDKHDVDGYMATAWCRHDSFYEGAFPYMAYAVARWSGRAKTKEDGIKIYADLLGGDYRLAKLIFNLDVVEVAPNFDPLNLSFNDTLMLHNYRNTFEYALEEIRDRLPALTGLAYDIAIDIYDYIFEVYLNMRLCKLSEKIFDNYDGKQMNLPALIGDAEEIKSGYEEIRENGEKLWAKYRKGVVSRDNGFNNKFEKREKTLNDIILGLKENKRKGVLFMNFAATEFYYTVKNTVKVKYVGEEEQLVFDGSLKPNESLFEIGGTFGVRFAIADKPVEYVKFGSYAEGMFMPQNFRYYTRGDKYIASDVQVVSGKVVDAEKILYNDTRFAQMGYERGVDHLNDLDLSRELHEIKITFEKLV